MMYMSYVTVFPQFRLSLEAASQTEDGVMFNIETRESKILLLYAENCVSLLSGENIANVGPNTNLNFRK